MNRVTLKLFPCYLLGLFTMAVVSWLVACVFGAVPSLSQIHWFFRLLPGLPWMVGALAVHLRAKGRKGLYILSYLLNAAGSGCAIGAVWGKASILPPPELLAALLPAAVLGGLICLIPTGTGRFWKVFDGGLGTVLALVLVGMGIYVWNCRDCLTGCTFVFSGLFLLPFPICCKTLAKLSHERYRYLSFAGFGAFLLIVFAAAFILSEGEILDGLDFDLGGGGKKREKRVK